MQIWPWLAEDFGLPTIPDYDTTGKDGLGCRLKYLSEANLIDNNGMATADAKTAYSGAILDTKKNGAATCTH